MTIQLVKEDEGSGLVHDARPLLDLSLGRDQCRFMNCDINILLCSDQSTALQHYYMHILTRNKALLNCIGRSGQRLQQRRHAPSLHQVLFVGWREHRSTGVRTSNPAHNHRTPLLRARVWHRGMLQARRGAVSLELNERGDSKQQRKQHQ